MRNFNRIVLLISGIISFFNAGGLMWASSAQGDTGYLTRPAVIWGIVGVIFLYFSYRSWRKDIPNDKRQ